MFLINILLCIFSLSTPLYLCAWCYLQCSFNNISTNISNSSSCLPWPFMVFHFGVVPYPVLLAFMLTHPLWSLRFLLPCNTAFKFYSQGAVAGPFVGPSNMIFLIIILVNMVVCAQTTVQSLSDLLLNEVKLQLGFWLALLFGNRSVSSPWLPLY